MTTRSINACLLHPVVRPLVWVGCASPGLYLVWAVWADQLGANPAEALIRGLGEWALQALCATLLVSPLRHVTGWHALARWRRWLGVTAFGYACLHLLAYAWLDMGWVWPDLGADVLQRPFIAVGLLAWLLMWPLAATSFNRAIRWLGARRWQALHRTVYGIALLVLLHYYWMRAGKNQWDQVHPYAVWVAVLFLWRVWHRYRARPHRPGA